MKHLIFLSCTCTLTAKAKQRLRWDKEIFIKTPLGTRVTQPSSPILVQMYIYPCTCMQTPRSSLFLNSLPWPEPRPEPGIANTANRPVYDPKRDSYGHLHVSPDAVAAVLTTGWTPLGQQCRLARALRPSTGSNVSTRVCRGAGAHLQARRGLAGTWLGVHGHTDARGCTHVHTRACACTSTRGWPPSLALPP